MVENNKKLILIIIDGLGDLPAPKKTPLQMAKKTNLDALARDGITGLIAPLGKGVIPGSDTSHLQYFGYDPKIYYCGRGPLEALGIGERLRDEDIAFRTNFATLEGTEIINRRAGRIDSETARKLEDAINMTIENVEIIFKSSVEHRGVLILRGNGLNAAVSDTDQHTIRKIKHCEPLDDSAEAKKTADIINILTNHAREHLEKHPENIRRVKKGLLPANGLLLRGGGIYRKIDNMKSRFGILVACVAGGALYKGIARYVGMNVIEVKGATGTKDTDLNAKADAAIETLKTHDLVFLHIKACDSFSHDGDTKGKIKMIEKIDKQVIAKLRESNATIIVTADHSTPCILKEHSGYEVPILIYEKEGRRDDVRKFDEISCMKGGLGHIEGKDLMPIILNLIRKGKIYGL